MKKSIVYVNMGSIFVTETNTKTNIMTTTIKYNKKQLRKSNEILDSKGLILVDNGDGLKCIIKYSIENIEKGLFRCESTLKLIDQINRDMNNLGSISSYSINLQ